MIFFQKGLLHYIIFVDVNIVHKKSQDLSGRPWLEREKNLRCIRRISDKLAFMHGKTRMISEDNNIMYGKQGQFLAYIRSPGYPLREV
jgi:hypothetical protein